MSKAYFLFLCLLVGLGIGEIIRGDRTLMVTLCTGFNINSLIDAAKAL